MNRQEADILLALSNTLLSNQRVLAKESGHSLGIVNRSLLRLKEEGYLDDAFRCTKKALDLMEQNVPKNAVILADGFGMRMVPLNLEISKAFLEIKGECLIERLIKQLHEVGIFDITVVVGYMKEEFDYLIDLYGVTLKVNTNYGVYNNLHSLALVAEKIGNTYILPCDIHCAVNPFCKKELYSWYALSNKEDSLSRMRVNRNMEVVKEHGKTSGQDMIGITYLTNDLAQVVRKRLEVYTNNPAYDNAFYEEALFENNRMITQAKVFSAEAIARIDTYEQFRSFDGDFNHLKTEAIAVIAKALAVSADQISEIAVLKSGMTNRSFLFSCNDKKYIMRIPGEGTDKLINRQEEAKVYQTIQSQNICDTIVYIDPVKGYKITEFVSDTRNCDPFRPEEVKACMKKLRAFHELQLKVNHDFDLFAHINYYEGLRGNTPSMYRDYEKTKEHIFSLQAYIDVNKREYSLTHIDAVPANFLFHTDDAGEEQILLIDWEYAGMQDTDVDIAMFAIYSLYEKEQIDRLIDAYYTEGCAETVKTKIYAYIAVCGLLWSNWCEYKKTLGVEFGEYSLKQYRYAKDYYQLVKERMQEETSCI